MAGKDNHRWYGSNCFCPTCANPDGRKSCTPGDACEDHNVERDDYERSDDRASGRAACDGCRGRHRVAELTEVDAFLAANHWAATGR
jgi:hypothetical protein